MTDPIHLEKMGRELKCPICLRLLNSAVSLSCNHIFCKSCISQSMKSHSDCPICKLPYRRREVRPAPHMDNLVSIYRSMEIASGFNIFVTQTDQAAKSPDKATQVSHGATSSTAKDIDCGLKERVENRKPRTSCLGSKKGIRKKQEVSAPSTSNPSFPAKKRVQVPQYPLSETPIKGARGNQMVSEGNPVTTEDGDLPLSPLFWLRDDDAERLSQTVDDHDDYLGLSNLSMPTFSDIKDSSNNDSARLSPTGEEINGNPLFADDSDCETFGCTQRPSSVEIFTTPIEMQDDSTDKVNQIHKAASSVALIGVTDQVPSEASCPRDRNAQTVHEYPKKRLRHAGGGILRRCPEMNVGTCLNLLSASTVQSGKLGRSALSLADDEMLDEWATSFSKSHESDAQGQSKTTGKVRRKKIVSKSDLSRKLKKQKLVSRQIDTDVEVHGRSNNLDKEKQHRDIKINIIKCAFCHSPEVSEASGHMINYYNGRPVAANYVDQSKVIHCHKSCAEWAPNVYFEDDVAVNLEAELARSRRIKCSCCELKGAALGCYEKTCRKSFHVPCAKMIPECRWDNENFVILCPIHSSSSKFPIEERGSQWRKTDICSERQNRNKSKGVIDRGFSRSHTSDWCFPPYKLVLCCSALTDAERELVNECESKFGAKIMKKWDSSVTHVIASTDTNGACKRTVKILMGILWGKWILNIDWIKDSMTAQKIMEEEPYEINVDIHGIKDGPRLGRLRIQNKQEKIFEGFKFYFMGEFTPSYKGYLQELITVAGGSILHRKPIKESAPGSTLIIYNSEVLEKDNQKMIDTILRHRECDAREMADSTGAKAVSNLWVLNSIAACQLQTFPS
ncbi:Protein BREAST CANCER SUSCEPTIBILITY 1 homolog [Linum grandiflorum]